MVYLPPGYPEPNRRYPVLYMQDGQNLFDPATAFGGNDWRVHETADALITEGSVEPLIIVGIGNTGEFRIDEYTPTKDRRIGSGGKAVRYASLIIKELKPFIDREYPTLMDNGNTALGGSSLGGLVSLYIGLAHPLVFGRLAIFSPSVWWDDRSIIDKVRTYRSSRHARLWLDIGTREGGSPEQIVRDVRSLRDVLVQRGWCENQNLFYHEAEGAEHSEIAWRDRVGPMLRCLFPRH